MPVLRVRDTGGVYVAHALNGSVSDTPGVGSVTILTASSRARLDGGSSHSVARGMGAAQQVWAMSVVREMMEVIISTTWKEMWTILGNS